MKKLLRKKIMRYEASINEVVDVGFGRPSLTTTTTICSVQSCPFNDVILRKGDVANWLKWIITNIWNTQEY